MRERNFQEFFDVLGIKPEPVDEYYTPDAYGKKLMDSIYSYEGVIYSDSTTLYSQELVADNK